MLNSPNTRNDAPESGNETTAAMILAAGGGSRMGALKQLLAFEGETLISHAIRQAKGAGFNRIVVVLGSHADEVREAIQGQNSETAVNPEWSSGMGSSIRAGMKYFRKHGPMPGRIAVLLTDQPLIRSRHISAMLELQSSTKAPLVSAEYDDRPGVPAIFTREMYPFLEQLPLETGARHLLRDGRLKVVTYPLPEAATDLDTPADLAALEAMRP